MQFAEMKRVGRACERSHTCNVIAVTDVLDRMSYYYGHEVQVMNPPWKGILL